MVIISFVISDKVTKKEIAVYDSSSTDIDDDNNKDDYNAIKTKGQELLNLGTSLEIDKRYKLEIGNYALYYLLGKTDAFYQIISSQIHVDIAVDNGIFGLIEEAEKENIRGQVDQYDNLTSSGKSNFNAMILRYQELLPNFAHSTRSETQGSLRGYQQSEIIEMKDIKEEVVEIDNSQPVQNISISHASLYEDSSKATLFYFRIARAIVWSSSFIITLLSIYFILDKYA